MRPASASQGPLPDCCLILPPLDYAAFLAVLEAPPAPNQALRALAGRRPLWSPEMMRRKSPAAAPAEAAPRQELATRLVQLREAHANAARILAGNWTDCPPEARAALDDIARDVAAAIQGSGGVDYAAAILVLETAMADLAEMIAVHWPNRPADIKANLDAQIAVANLALVSTEPEAVS